MKSRASLIIAIVILLIALGIMAYMLTRASETVTINETPKDTVQRGVWPSEEVRQESVNDSGRGYKITATYPVTESESVTNYFRTFVDDAVTQFKQDTAWVADIENPEANSVSLEIDYTRVKGAQADNYIFQIATYTGGAHGLEATKTFTFLPDGAPVTVAMLFTNGVEGLKTVAPLVQKQLKNREFSEDNWITEGAAPIEQNYQNFTITDNAVTFIFDPYQVAAYAVGVQKVVIPVSAFAKIANADVFGR